MNCSWFGVIDRKECRVIGFVRLRSAASSASDVGCVVEIKVEMAGSVTDRCYNFYCKYSCDLLARLANIALI